MVHAQKAGARLLVLVAGPRPLLFVATLSASSALAAFIDPRSLCVAPVGLKLADRHQGWCHPAWCSLPPRPASPSRLHGPRTHPQPSGDQV